MECGKNWGMTTQQADESPENDLRKYILITALEK